MPEQTTDRILVELVTPDKLMLREEVLAVSLPGREGYLGILPGHAALLTELKPGQLSYTHGTTTHYLFVAGGFAEVQPHRVTVLVEASERPEEIDVQRARRAQQRAEERLRQAGAGQAEIDAVRAQAALQRAMARLDVAERAKQEQA
ncbi:MAG TPA: F0F1 ATP synthase subunit epsilon [Terriglobia bacterium]|nr:F0F1 ATP synthase subunit epsilon [Terriglobia bacterium]